MVQSGEDEVKLQVTADTKQYGMQDVDWTRTMRHYLELERCGVRLPNLPLF